MLENEDEKTKDPLLRVAYLGSLAEDFVNSDLGKAVLTRLNSEIEEAQETLESVAPWRFRKIMLLQERLRMLRKMPIYLAELMQDGRNSLRILEEQEE